MSISRVASDGTNPRDNGESPMDTTHIATIRRSLSFAASRRGLVASLSGGLIAAESPGLGLDAKAKKKANKKRKNKKRKHTKQTTRADAACASVNAIDSAVGGLARLAQTFTALSSGSLVSAQLDIHKGSGSVGDYILRLSPVDGAGIPTDEVLATGFVPNGNVPDEESTVTFSFASPAKVDAGTQYALVLARPGQDNFTWMTRAGDPCVGQRFVSNSPTAPFEVIVGTDLVYATFVRS